MIHASMKNSLGPGSQAVSNTAAVTPGWEFGHGDQTIQTKPKKKHSKQSDNQQGGATGNTPASTSTNDPELGTQIANQVIAGLLPQLSGAIATAIGSVVDTLVKQAVQNATAFISSTMQRQCHLNHFHHPQEVLLAQFSLYVHKGGLKPDSLLLLPCNDSLCCYVMNRIAWSSTQDGNLSGWLESPVTTMRRLSSYLRNY